VASRRDLVRAEHGRRRQRRARRSAPKCPRVLLRQRPGTPRSGTVLPLPLSPPPRPSMLTPLFDTLHVLQNVFLTGTPVRMPGLSDRLHATLRPILPPEMPLRIVRAADPSLDAWRGMAAFAQTEEFARVGVSKAEYEEWGGERVRRWWGGNWNASVA